MNNAPSQVGTVPMLFMVLERYKNPKALYARFHKKGRMLPTGLHYIASWVDKDANRCFQLMETHEPGLFAKWTREWDDIVDFEIIEVVSSKTAQRAAGRTDGKRAMMKNSSL